MNERRVPGSGRAIKPLTLGKLAWVVVVELGFLFGVHRVARVLDALTPEFYFFLGLQAALFFAVTIPYVHHLNPRPDAPDLQRARTLRAHRAVLASWHIGALVTIVILALAVRQRFHMDPGSVALFWGSVALICGGLLWVLRKDAGFDREHRHRPPSIVQVSTALMLLPIVVSWVLASGYWWLTRPVTPETPRARLRAVIDRREQAAIASPVIVAMTLSGGAYRAGAFHAGVLEQLEAEQVPIAYLSTNSGGSIVGAYYALGHTPEEFIQRYNANGGPRLANDFFAAGAVIGHLVIPGYTSGDMFTNHFARVFFGSRTLQTGCFPALFVNVTDYASGAGQTYHCPTGRVAEGQVEVARVVAASGALPGIASSVQIGAGHFMDGAARDNLAYIGLQEYLEKNTNALRPGFLIMSNATLPLAPEPPPGKVSLVSAFLRSHMALLDEERRQVIRHVKTRGFRGPQPDPATLASYGVTPDEMQLVLARLRAEIAQTPGAAEVIRREPAVLDELVRNPGILKVVRDDPRRLGEIKARWALAASPSPAAAVASGVNVARLASIVVGAENAYAVVLTLAEVDRKGLPSRYLECSGKPEAERERDIREAVWLTPLGEPDARQMSVVRCLGRKMAQAWDVGCRLRAVGSLKDPDRECARPDL